MPYPADFKYTKEHEWIKVEGNTATIGITRLIASSKKDGRCKEHQQRQRDPQILRHARLSEQSGRRKRRK